ncbi:hypothetical protein SLS56_001450 [Neofusicoccum ribis]|uniref:Uncharacterized protein n=1 Tax=Neofusicoccum ribis TaxID=45134 RepID=A0ABR3T966_9PEZI
MVSISTAGDRCVFLEWQETLFNDYLKKFDSAKNEEKRGQIVDLWTQCCSLRELDSRLDRWLMERQTFLKELHAWVNHRNNQTRKILNRVIDPENPRGKLTADEAWSKLESAMTINDSKWKAYTSDNNRLTREAPFLVRSCVHLGGVDAMKSVEKASSDWNRMADAQVIAALRHLSKECEDLYDFEMIAEQRDIGAGVMKELSDTTDFWRNVLGRRDSSVPTNDGNAHDKILDDDLLERWKKWTDSLTDSFHNWIVPPKQMRIKGKMKAVDVEHFKDEDDQPPKSSAPTVSPDTRNEEVGEDEAQDDEAVSPGHVSPETRSEHETDRLEKTSQDDKSGTSQPDLPERDSKGIAKHLEETSQDDEVRE